MKHIFDPKSIALIGATDRPSSVGKGLATNLLNKNVFFVNPNKKRVLSKKTYPQVGNIKQDIDLAVIAVPARIVLKIVKECIKKKVKAIIIISSGFAEIGNTKLQEQIQRLVKLNNIDLIGPNCLGILRPITGLNASFAPLTPKTGEIALISQSGALLDSVIDQSFNKAYGFSAIISYGNEAGLKLTDFLEWAAKDSETKVISLYVEGLQNGREFFEICKKITKPIVVLKGGKTKTAKKAVTSHTGALAGETEIYSAAFKQAGVIEVDSIEQLLDVSKALAWQPRCKNGIGIVSNGGGVAILAADYCDKHDIHLPELKFKMPKRWSQNNPLDIIGDATTKDYALAINSMLKQSNIHGLIVLQTVQIMTDSLENAKIIIEAKKKKPIITAFLGEKNTRKAVKLLEKNKIPNYTDPLEAVEAMRALIK